MSVYWWVIIGGSLTILLLGRALLRLLATIPDDAEE